MRCRACDRNLSDAESTRQYPNSTEYIDMCGPCSKWIFLDIDDDLDVEEDHIPLDDLDVVDTDRIDE